MTDTPVAALILSCGARHLTQVRPQGRAMPRVIFWERRVFLYDETVFVRNRFEPGQTYRYRELTETEQMRVE